MVAHGRLDSLEMGDVLAHASFLLNRHVPDVRSIRTFSIMAALGVEINPRCSNSFFLLLLF